MVATRGSTGGSTRSRAESNSLSSAKKEADRLQDDSSDADSGSGDAELQNLVEMTAKRMRSYCASSEAFFAHNEPKVKKRLQPSSKFTLASSLDGGAPIHTYISMGPEAGPSGLHSGEPAKITPSLNEVMKKSVLTSDLEKRDCLPPYEESVRAQKKRNQIQREKTKGKKWFDMPATEMTEELKKDLTVLKMRKVLDPKRFYKGDDIKGLPKYFQMGTIVDSHQDFYHGRIPKKQRKQTMVDELLADDQFRKYNKKKYTEIQDAKRKTGAFKHMKRLKKRKR